MDLDDLIDSFEYDAWANRRWFPKLGLFPDIDRAKDIFSHMLWAQQIWLKRVGVPEGFGVSDEPSQESIETLKHLWIERLKKGPLDEVIQYQTMAGEDHERTLGEIAKHVINHGTYHRGHLRGLAHAAGIGDFPETDYIYYLIEKKDGPLR